MATRKGRENRAYSYAVGVDGYKSLFNALFCTAFEVKGIETGKDGLDSNYIISTLYERGKIAFDKVTGLWLRYSNVGRPNAYGEPLRVRLWGRDGANFERDRKDVYLFKANPTAFPWSRIIDNKCLFLADCDNAIAQNLDGIKQMTAIVTESELVAQILAHINNQRQQGQSVAIVSPAYWSSDANEIAQANATLQGLDTIKTGAEFYLDRIRAEKRREYEEILHLIGIQTGYEKGERMTDNEIETYNAESRAYVSVLRKTFNDAAKAQNAPFTVELVQGWTDRQDEQKTPKNEPLTGENEEGGTDNGEA